MTSAPTRLRHNGRYRFCAILSDDTRPAPRALHVGPQVTDRTIDREQPELPDATLRLDRSPRKNLLLSATVQSGELKAPVRIRNLSETGAMLDGAALPQVGAALVLRRSDIEIGATVVWRNAGRCGIEFGGVASVEEWIAGRRLPELSYGHGQARVDAIQAAIRSGSIAETDEPSPNTIAINPSEIDARIAEEFAYVGRLLEEVGDELSDDPVTLKRHGQALQNFDIACQLISQLAAIATASDRAAAMEAVTMGELRSRLLRKTIF